MNNLFDDGQEYSFINSDVGLDEFIFNLGNRDYDFTVNYRFMAFETIDIQSSQDRLPTFSADIITRNPSIFALGLRNSLIKR